MTRYQNFLIGLIALILSDGVIAMPIEEKWGAPLKGPFGLKEYVVAILSAKSQPDFEKQKLKVEKPTAVLLDMIEIMPLLYSYDSFGAERDIEDLAKLTPYYLGEAEGTLYECLLLRKGQMVLPALKKLADNKSNECIDRFGGGANICRSEIEYRKSLAKYIETISSLTKTHSTTSLCTTNGWSSM